MMAAQKEMMSNTSEANVPIQRLDLSSQPLQNTFEQQQAMQVIGGFMKGIAVSLAYSFVSCGVAAYVTMESQTDARHPLQVSGCRSSAYWLSNSIFDHGMCLITIVGCLWVLYLFNATDFLDNSSIGATLMLLLEFCWAGPDFGYLLSFLFDAGAALVWGSHIQPLVCIHRDQHSFDAAVRLRDQGRWLRHPMVTMQHDSTLLSRH